MSLSNINSRQGFLLLEAIIACMLMSIMVLSIAQYQWHIHTQNIQVSKQINLLFDVHTFFEEKEYQRKSSGLKEGESGMISWQKLPVIQRDTVSMQPMQVELQYIVAGRKHAFKLISMSPKSR